MFQKIPGYQHKVSSRVHKICASEFTTRAQRCCSKQKVEYTQRSNYILHANTSIHLHEQLKNIRIFSKNINLERIYKYHL